MYSHGSHVILAARVGPSIPDAAKKRRPSIGKFFLNP